VFPKEIGSKADQYLGWEVGGDLLDENGAERNGRNISGKLSNMFPSAANNLIEDSLLPIFQSHPVLPVDTILFFCDQHRLSDEAESHVA
jgi:hypothetical protein